MSDTQSHIVVVFDHEMDMFFIDWDSTLARFQGGIHWKNGQWVNDEKLNPEEFKNFEIFLQKLQKTFIDLKGE